MLTAGGLREAASSTAAFRALFHAEVAEKGGVLVGEFPATGVPHLDQRIVYTAHGAQGGSRDSFAHVLAPVDRRDPNGGQWECAARRVVVERTEETRWIFAEAPCIEALPVAIQHSSWPRGLPLPSVVGLRCFHGVGIDNPIHKYGTIVNIKGHRPTAGGWYLGSDSWFPVVSAPGIVWSCINLASWRKLILSVPDSMPRIAKATFNAAINNAKRGLKVERDMSVLFMGEEGGSQFDPTRLDSIWSRMRQDARSTISVTLLRMTNNLNRTRQRVMEAEQMQAASKLSTALDAAVEEGELEEWRVAGSTLLLLLAPQLVSDAEGGEKVYQTPPAVVSVPIGLTNPETDIRVHMEDGSRYRHPHVIHADGRLCWGEYPRHTLKNTELALDLWNTNPREFVAWFRGLMGSYYGDDDPAGRYHPFRTWCMEVKKDAP